MCLPNPVNHEQNVIQGQFFRGVCVYPTPLRWAGCDTRSIFQRSMCLPNPSTMCRMWHEVNFSEEYVFTQPLYHEQDVTRGQFFRGVLVYPTPLRWAGCDTRSIFQRSMCLSNPSTMSRMWHEVNFSEEYVFTQPLYHEQDVTRGQFFRGVLVYPTPLRWAGCDTRSIFQRSMCLSNPSTMSRMWHEVNFSEEYVFTQPLYHEQDVTQGQFLSKVALAWIQNFSFFSTFWLSKAKEPSMSCNLPIVGNEMQTALSRISIRAHRVHFLRQ